MPEAKRAPGRPDAARSHGGDRGGRKPAALIASGETVALGPPRLDLVPLYHRWSNDVNIARDMGAPHPVTVEATRAAYDTLVATDREVGFTIYQTETWQPIGDASLELDIPPARGYPDRRQSAELTIRIGEAAYRGRGFGTAATRLVLRHAFVGLALHSVVLSVAEFNTAARRAYAKAGFRECGRRREYRFVDGRWWDSIYMDCLAREFEAADTAPATCAES